MLFDLDYTGSFQSGQWISTENPLDEIWTRLALYGSSDYVSENFTVNGTKAPPDICNFVCVRMLQAVELRRASNNMTLLTKPLPLYYSFLNLLRACFASVQEKIPKSGHGLKYHSAADILGCAATLCGGTFTTYLEANGATWARSRAVTLEDCICRTPESAGDYHTITSKFALAIPVSITARHSGSMYLNFNPSFYGEESEFRSKWEQEFPGLATYCDLEPMGCVLRVKESKKPKNRHEVCQLCALLLEVNLIPGNGPWAAIRQTDLNLLWPRAAYYFAALFILSSIVRYEPERLLEITSTNSSVAWLLNRYSSAAERFFPHLMFNWIHKQAHFFGIF